MIIYSSNTEILVCDNKREKELLKVYFVKGKRNLDDYDRDECKKGVIEIKNRMIVSLGF